MTAPGPLRNCSLCILLTGGAGRAAKSHTLHSSRFGAPKSVESEFLFHCCSDPSLFCWLVTNWHTFWLGRTLMPGVHPSICSYCVPVMVLTPPMKGPRTTRDRLPPPWHHELIPGGICNGTPLAYVYAPEEGANSAIPGVTLTRAEARSLARAIARLAEVE